MASETKTAAPAVPDSDQHVRRGRRGFPLLPGGYGRDAYHTGAAPVYAVRGEGHRLWDDRGRELIDANNNFTTLVHGNAHPQIVEAATRAMDSGACWGIPNLGEWELADLLLQRLPGLDQVRFTNSGTEAVMSAVRVAREVTGRTGVIMTRGGYHGSSDVALCAGGEQSARGVPESTVREVSLVPLNDIDSLRQVIEEKPHHHAAIVLDLLPNRAGLISVTADFLRAARELADQHGILLVIDEVISLRIGAGGLSGEYGIVPDLLTAGKLIGGGFPVGALAGREEFMRVLDPRSKGSIPHSGTFSGNPVSMAAGTEALRLLSPDTVARLNRLGDQARRVVAARVEPLGWEVRGAGSLLRVFPAGVTGVDRETQHRLWWAAYDRGLLLSSANLAALSTPMTTEVVGDLADRLADAVAAVAEATP
ncbi:aspartate aminotransferase family protein [Streptomyces caeruleatus]|uniref:Aminotransferase class III n=1 Tax=Streptomyces caeruleatus TaxID=661399 RepID=A0A101U8Z1_9ACTN|nr:aminotransferase class III-fold pyridoxal phosphate-dependent enzyme [Streptomyces caeruleatus]KUO06151.1 aminotransferase class III [Streptomyces caeruleatus]